MGDELTNARIEAGRVRAVQASKDDVHGIFIKKRKGYEIASYNGRENEKVKLIV